MFWKVRMVSGTRVFSAGSEGIVRSCITLVCTVSAAAAIPIRIARGRIVVVTAAVALRGGSAVRGAVRSMLRRVGIVRVRGVVAGGRWRVHLMDVVMLLLVLLVLLLLLLLLVVVAAVLEVRLLSVGLVRVTCLAVAVVRLGGVGGGMHQAAADEPLGDVEVDCGDRDGLGQRCADRRTFPLEQARVLRRLLVHICLWFLRTQGSIIYLYS